MKLVLELRKEKELLLERIKAIDMYLSTYDNDMSPENQTVANFSRENSKNFDDFPLSGRTDKQIMWLFNNRIKQGIKLGDLQKLYNEKVSSDNPKKIANIARRLKREGRLVIVQYNNMNKLSFWGLPSWIGVGDFKSEHKPDENMLPLSIQNKQIIGE